MTATFYYKLYMKPLEEPTFEEFKENYEVDLSPLDQQEDTLLFNLFCKRKDQDDSRYLSIGDPIVYQPLNDLYLRAFNWHVNNGVFRLFTIEK